MQHAEVLPGTFEGHALPGAVFILWALFWAWQAVSRRGAQPAEGTLESGPFLVWFKMVFAGVGVWTEIPGEGWYPHDVMMSSQHVVMYAVFGLTGVVDLLARVGRLSHQATYVAYAAAMANAGFLFWGHSMHGGVEALVHTLLAILFFGTAVLALVETMRPAEGLRWGRISLQIALGVWFWVGGWIIYLSGWDLMDPVREGWTRMAFSWTGTGAAVVTVLAVLAARARQPTVS